MHYLRRPRGPVRSNPLLRWIEEDGAAFWRPRQASHAWDRPETLDRVGPKLCAAGSGFHAHASERTLVGGASSEGSIWAAGVGGLGVEFHADFDWSFFDEDRVSMLDYCSVSSKGRCTADSCDESQLIR